MIKACGNRIIVRIPDVSEQMSGGGIVLPGSGQGLVVGEVLSVGEGRSDTEKQPCEAGDFIYFNRSQHETIVDKDHEYKYLILEFGQILAVKTPE